MSGGARGWCGGNRWRLCCLKYGLCFEELGGCWLGIRKRLRMF